MTTTPTTETTDPAATAAEAAVPEATGSTGYTEEQYRDLEALLAVRAFGWRWMQAIRHNYEPVIGRVAIFPPERDGWVRFNYYAPNWQDVTEAYLQAPEEFERFSDWDMYCAREDDRGWRMRERGLPRFCRGGSATDEVRRWVNGRPWKIGTDAYSPREDGRGLVTIEILSLTDFSRLAHTRAVFYDDHGGDPIAAEATALVRATIAACEAIGAGVGVDGGGVGREEVQSG